MSKQSELVTNEKELDRTYTLQSLKQGISLSEIARQLGRSTTYVTNIRDYLIANKLITKSEIDLARFDENRRNKRVQEKQQEQQLKAQILEDIKKGKTLPEIVTKFKIRKQTIRKYIAELLQEEKDLEKQNEKSRQAEEASDHSTGKSQGINHVSITDEILTKQEIEVLQWLKKGYQYGFIVGQLKISQNDLIKIVNSLKNKGVISLKQIQQYRDEKRINDEKEVTSYLKMEYTQADILARKKEFNLEYLYRMINRLKREGRIKDQKMVKNQDSTNFTKEEAKHQQIANEKTSFDKTDNQQQLNAKTEPTDSQYKTDEEILELIKRGAMPQEIANFLKLRKDFVQNRCQEILREHNITNEDLAEYKQERASLFFTTKESAKKEMDEDNRATVSRKSFFELAKMEIRYGNDLSKEDVAILGRAMILESRLLNKSNLKMVIMQYIKLGNLRRYK